MPEAGKGVVQVRVTDAPRKGVFGVQIKVKDVEIHRARDGKWVAILPEVKEFDLLSVSGVEQILGNPSVEAGDYTQIRLRVAEATVTLGDRKVAATVPSREVKLVGSFKVEAGKTTVISLDFDAEASLVLTATGEAILKPVVKLEVDSPVTQPRPIRLASITKSGLLATLPKYAQVDLSAAQALISQVYPGRVPRQLQAFLLLTSDDEAYMVIAIDTSIDRYITAATVSGRRAPSLVAVPKELDWARRVIISDSITLLQPLPVSPARVNAEPGRYAFKRVVMDTTYLFSSARIKVQAATTRVGLGLATDKFSSQQPADYLTIVDPYNTETQIRVANVYGTVLYPTEGTRLLLGKLYRFLPEDVKEILDRPSVFFERLEDDEAQPITIGELVPTPKDPALKLHKHHGEMVAIEGIAIGEMVRTEDIPQLKNSPIHFTFKAIGVADLTGAMPLIGISSEDVAGEVFGHFRFELSIYRFEGDKAYAFLISKKTVPLDPIAHVERAKFGDRVKTSLSGYTVTEIKEMKVASDLTLEQVDLLLPQDPQNPIIMTRHPALTTGDYLKTVAVDGYLIDGQFLGVPSTFFAKYSPKVVVVNRASLSYEKGPPPGPTLVPTPTPLPTPVTYTLTVSISASGWGTVALSPPGGIYPSGTVVTLTATPAPRYAFDRWDGSASGSGSVINITMDLNKSVTARFKSALP